MARTERETVTERIYIDLDDDLVVYVIKNLSDVLNKIPEEYRKEAMFVVDNDEWSCHYHIEYERPETDEEWDERIKEIAHAELNREYRERMEYERLKRKYDGHSAKAK